MSYFFLGTENDINAVVYIVSTMLAIIRLRGERLKKGYNLICIVHKYYSRLKYPIIGYVYVQDIE